MKLFGLRGFTHHGWSPLLTVMSAEGASRVVAHIRPTESIRVRAAPGALPRYYELRDGALDALIDEYAIEVVDREHWEGTRSRLGDSIYR